MKTQNDCEFDCDCDKRANVVLHVGLRKENSLLFVVFGRCRSKEPHSSGILLCRVVVVGYENGNFV